MDEKLVNGSKRVMLVQESGGPPRAVTGFDDDGNPRTVEVNQANLSGLLNVNTQESAIEAFFKKLMQQVEDPSHTGLKNAIDKVFILAGGVLDKLIKIDLDPELLENYRIEPMEWPPTLNGPQLEGREQPKLDEQYPVDTEYVDVTGQSALKSPDPKELPPFEPWDAEKIDREDMARKGIEWKSIEPQLKALTHGHKSNGLVDMNPELEPEGERVLTKGRIALEERPDGRLTVVPYYWRETPNLEEPIFNTLLPEDVKANLMETGHGQRPVNFEISPGIIEPCYVTLDRYTNDIEVLPVSYFGKTTRIKGVDLSEGQQIDFEAGRRITIEKFTTRAGYFKDGHVQRNAADRNFQFSFDGLDPKRYAAENAIIRQQKMAEARGEKTGLSPGDPASKMTVPKTIYGAPIPEKAQQEWKAAIENPDLRADVKAYYIKGMVKDGKTQDLWVKPNFEKGWYDRLKWNPDKSRKQTTAARPSEGQTTQGQKTSAVTPPRVRQAPSANQKPGQKKGGQKKGGQKI